MAGKSIWIGKSREREMNRKGIFIMILLAVVPLIACTEPSGTTEEDEVRQVVEGFGKKLQLVSLQSPNAPQEMKDLYSPLVSPALLEAWMNDVSKAPGRAVSSPWPERIEITRMEKEGPDKYIVSGFIVMVTSKEVVGGGAAARIPVRVVVERTQGRWMITEYSESRGT